MNTFETYSDLLSTHLQLVPPKRLYHYTSPEALIGIISNKEIWATNTMFMNDANEIRQATLQAEMAIDFQIKRANLGSEEVDLLNDFKGHLNAAADRFYVASFTESQDSLSQWRAYCPSSGGYNIGFPSSQISRMAEAQSFRLVKCIYDDTLQWNIMREIVEHFSTKYKQARKASNDIESIKKAITWSFFQHIAKIGVIMKHSAFAEEQEWRVVSSQIDETININISFRASHRGLVPYFKFKLANDDFPNLKGTDYVNLVVVVGPAPDIWNRTVSLQFLLSRYLGLGCGHSISQIPYKTW